MSGGSSNLYSFSILCTNQLKQFRDFYSPGKFINSGFSQSPDTEKSFEPDDLSVPNFANQLPPFKTMWLTAASVSTLLTDVGLPRYPVLIDKAVCCEVHHDAFE